jgi:hypothetical protein
VHLYAIRPTAVLMRIQIPILAHLSVFLEAAPVAVRCLAMTLLATLNNFGFAL